MSTVSENAILREMEVAELRNEGEKLIAEHYIGYKDGAYVGFDSIEADSRFKQIQKQIKQLVHSK